MDGNIRSVHIPVDLGLVRVKRTHEDLHCAIGSVQMTYTELSKKIIYNSATAVDMCAPKKKWVKLTSGPFSHIFFSLYINDSNDKSETEWLVKFSNLCNERGEPVCEHTIFNVLIYALVVIS